MPNVGAFLGSPGSLIEFVHYRAGIGVEHSHDPTFQETIGGARFGYRAPGASLRTWDVSTSGLSSAQWQGFDLLRSGAYGDVHWWLDPLAQVTNMIPQRMSMPGLRGSTEGITGDALAGGLVATDEGLRVPSLVSGGGSAFVRCDVPVLAGMPVTLSAYVAGTNARVTAGFSDASGKYITGVSVGATTSSTVKRVGATLTPPPGAASVYIGTYGATTVAAPAVTWTRELRPWTAGRGCDKSVISGVSEDIVQAGQWVGTERADFSFTVTEVGRA